MMAWLTYELERQRELLGKVQWSLRVMVLFAAVMIFCVLMVNMAADYLLARYVVGDAVTERSKDQVRHMVEAMAAVIEAAVLPGTMIGPEMGETTQELVKRLIRNAKYDGLNGYFFMFDLKGYVIAQGTEPEDAGHSHLHYPDVNGVRYIEEMIEQAQKGGGFVQYKIAKRDRGMPSPKISYAKLLNGGRWWIATGVYLDRIEQVTDDKLNQHRWYKGVLMVGLLAIMGLLLSIVLRSGNILGDQIAQPMVEQMKGFAKLSDETRRVHAGVLHNLVGRMIVLVKHKLSEMVHTEDVTTRQMLKQQASVMIADFDETCQRLERDIYPLVVQEYGVGAMTQLVEEETEGRETPRIDLSIHEHVPRSDNGRECALYLVAQGLLQNVLKSAQATQVRIALAFQEETVTLTVEDNGTGFDVGAVVQRTLSSQTRYGIPWMLAQVEVYGGHITFDSSMGQGTTVRVTIPWPPLTEPQNRS